ncbi:vesicle transport through interaction with t-SNAREs homolog 1B-like [Babylonia areolata]|uniref:vesicle transport through interaction with t-SNAREs homolog 1B-like n=1 Tax=Babylonia areolata TaxID=304850 RepID=UPI003FD1A5EF
MSSEKFESLEDDLSSILDDIKTKERKITGVSGEERKNAVRQIERKIEEATLVLQEMEGEAKVAPVSYRTQMLSKIRHYRAEVEQSSRSLKREGTSGARGADNYAFDREDRLDASNRAKLLQGNQSLQRTSESIARSRQIAEETDTIGVEIIDELDTQRETLLRTKDKLTDTDQNLGRSRKILKTMARRMMTNKLILAVIILVELAILGGLVYWKFFS